MEKFFFLGLRALSYIIDYIVFIVLSYFLGVLGVVGYSLALMLFFTYRLLTTFFLGSTIGMLILKLKLTEHKFITCLKREIYRFASALFFAGYIYAVFDKKGRTLHDIAADTMVVNKGHNEEDKYSSRIDIIIKIAAVFILIISVIKWTSNYLLNDVGLIGLNKICESEEYYQSFAGDNLISTSQDELYKKTFGRKYTTVIDVNNKPALIRVSNKSKYVDVYTLNIKNDKLMGEFLYKINIPIQYICSGCFKEKIDLSCVSPRGMLLLLNQNGKIYGRNTTGINSILRLSCGDIDNDKLSEIIVLGKEGEIEIFKYKKNKLAKIYAGVISEDIAPEAVFIDKGIVIAGKGENKTIFYFYKYENNKLILKYEKYFKGEGITSIAKLNENLLVSHVFRNNMIFRQGKIQRLEVYSLKKNNGIFSRLIKSKDKIQRLYNFGSRKGRMYKYMVRSLEGVFDFNGDGEQEIILKAVNSEDVQGHGYKIEIYRLSKPLLLLNRLLTF